MSPSEQGMRVSATVRKQWMQNVVLDTVEQLIIRVFDQLGGRRLVGTAVTGNAHLGVEILQCAAGLRPW